MCLQEMDGRSLDPGMVSPDVLTIAKERFEVRDGWLTVLRPLSEEEIQAYVDATQILRGMPSSSPWLGTGVIFQTSYK